ncbi:ferredoxin family protein [Candidatus Chlorohelix sp.]|uniref:4Fe-4S dicluster domain-containing protein n=1 Tax=Candidatus Chlorohelix sp. TaxID=3139201 RepID=UPI00304ABE03
MAYVITEPCVDVMDKSCVNVCPVDCIYSDENDRSLFINPDECIDCGACEPECPVSAIFAEEEVPDKSKAFPGINKLYFTDKAAARAQLDKLIPKKAK